MKENNYKVTINTICMYTCKTDHKTRNNYFKLLRLILLIRYALHFMIFRSSASNTNRRNDTTDGMGARTNTSAIYGNFWVWVVVSLSVLLMICCICILMYSKNKCKNILLFLRCQFFFISKSHLTEN